MGSSAGEAQALGQGSRAAARKRIREAVKAPLREVAKQLPGVTGDQLTEMFASAALRAGPWVAVVDDGWGRPNALLTRYAAAQPVRVVIPGVGFEPVWTSARGGVSGLAFGFVLGSEDRARSLLYPMTPEMAVRTMQERLLLPGSPAVPFEATAKLALPLPRSSVVAGTEVEVLGVAIPGGRRFPVSQPPAYGEAHGLRRSMDLGREPNLHDALRLSCYLDAVRELVRFSARSGVVRWVDREGNLQSERRSGREQLRRVEKARSDLDEAPPFWLARDALAFPGGDADLAPKVADPRQPISAKQVEAEFKLWSQLPSGGPARGD